MGTCVMIGIDLKPISPSMLQIVAATVTAAALALPGAYAGGNRPVATVDPLQGIADARSLVHEALWGSMASISSQHETLGMPFANIVSFSGGTGIPYMLVSPSDDTVQDYKHNAAMSLSLTRAQLPNTSSGGDLACAIDLGG